VDHSSNLRAQKRHTYPSIGEEQQWDSALEKSLAEASSGVGPGSISLS
jgi:hypothetical protein